MLQTTALSTAPFELTTPQLVLWPYGDGTYRVCSKSVAIMRRLNLLTGNYPTDTKFEAGDEALFRLKREQVAPALKAAFGEKAAASLLRGRTY